MEASRVIKIFCAAFSLLTAKPCSGVDLDWKCFGDWSVCPKTEPEVKEVLSEIKSLGFNSIMIYSNNGALATRKGITAARGMDLQTLVAVNPVYGGWGFEKAPGVDAPATMLQAYPAEEAERLNNPTNSDDVAYKGPWLCIDRPEVRRYAANLCLERMRELKPDGLVLDFIGYKNHKGCGCGFSRQQREEWADSNPGLPPGEVMRRHSLSSMAAFYRAIIEKVKKEFPAAVIACHVYPPFELDPLAGSCLPVDYPAETVAWYFKPHWPLTKVAARCAEIVRRARETGGQAHPTAMIGIDMADKSVKDAERVGREIRAVKDSGIKALMIAGAGAYHKVPAIAKVLKEELNPNILSKFEK